MASGPFAWHTLVVISNLAVTTNSLPGGQLGAPYSAAASAGGGAPPYSWQASGLPAGLSIDPASGQISGTPQDAGTAHVSLRVSDSFGIVASSAPIALSIEGAPIEPSSKAVKPTLENLRQSHRRWREGRKLARISRLATRRKERRAPIGTTFTFRLNKRAMVRLTFAVRKGKRFKRAGALTFAERAGKSRIRFQGRISPRKRLKPGRYKLIAIARSGGVRSESRSLRFAILGKAR